MWPEVEMQELRTTGQGGQVLTKRDLCEAKLPSRQKDQYSLVRTGFQVAHAGPRILLPLASQVLGSHMCTFVPGSSSELQARSLGVIMRIQRKRPQCWLHLTRDPGKRHGEALGQPVAS